MKTYKVTPDTLNAICFYENPQNKLDRIKERIEKIKNKLQETNETARITYMENKAIF